MKQNNTYKDYMYNKLRTNRENKRRKMYVVISLFLLFCSILVGLCFFYRSSNTSILNMFSGKLDTNVIHDEELVEDMYHFNIQNNSTTKFINDINLTVSSESDISSIPLTLVLENTTTNKITTLTSSKISKNELVYNFNEIIKPDAKNTDYVFKIVANTNEANYINYLFHFDVCCKTGNFGYKQGYNFEFERIGEPEIFTYEINKDRTVSITGLTDDYISKLQNGTETGFTIPTTYHNLPVYSVKENAFTSLPVNYTVAFDEGVEVIENNVFSKDTMRNTDIILPQSLRSLGSHNFTGMKLNNVEVNSNIDCNSPFENSTIKNITINNTSIIPNTVFNNVYSIENMNLSDEITTIGNNAFSNIDTMFDIFSLPDNILSIGNEAFMNTNIKTMELNKTVNIGARAFKNSSIVDLNIPTNVETINIDAFNSSKITNLTMNDLPTMHLNNNKSVFTDAVIDTFNLNNVNTIPNYTFNYTNRINHLNIGKKLVSVGTNAFANIDYVGNFTYDNTITNWNYAFYNTGLDSLIIAKGIETLPVKVFDQTKSINSIDFGELTNLTDYDFASIDMSKCDIVFPDTLTNLSFGCFSYSTIKSIQINNNLIKDIYEGNKQFYKSILNKVEFTEDITEIPKYMFFDTTQIDDLILPSNLININENAFRNCNLTNVDKIDLPDTLTNIGIHAFTSCGKIKYLVIPSKTTFTDRDDRSPFCWTAYGIVEFKDGRTEIPSYLFNESSSIDNLIFSSTITKIGYRAFKDIKINNIENWNNISYINGDAFMGCDFSDFIDFDFPSNLTEIGDHTFSSVTFNKNTVITIPKTLIKCADWSYPSFEGTTFYHLKIADGMTSLPSRLFQNCTIADPDFTLKNTNITKLNGYLFVDTNISNCINFDLPMELVDLGSCVFYNVSFNKNTTITIPKTLKSSSDDNWDQSFKGCTFYHLKIEDGLTTLPNRLFQNCTIADPDFTLKNTTITSIKYGVFSNTDLSTCTNFDLPKNLVSLDGCCFSNTQFSKDAVITIPKTLTSCGDYWNPSFGNTTIYHLQFEDGLTTIPDLLFCSTTIDDSDFTLKNTTITTINYSAFFNTNLSTCNNFDLPSNLISLKDKCFVGTQFSKDAIITIPKTLKNVGSWNAQSFNGTTIPHLKFEDGLTTIPWDLFGYAIITDPNFTLKDTTITSIGGRTFFGANLSACTNFDFPKNLESIEDECFVNTQFNEDTVITIPKTFKSSGGWTRQSLKTTIPHLQFEDGLTTIPWDLFGDATITDPNFTLKDTTITSIGGRAFANTNLSVCTKFELPTNIESIESECFLNTQLTDIYIYNKDVKISDNAFNNSTTIIHGYYGSTAETFAETKNLTFEPLDDLTPLFTYTTNDDGSITLNGIDTSADIYSKLKDKFVIPKKLGDKIVKDISEGMFENNSDIKAVSIKAPITKIPNNCFKNCTNLTKVEYPDSVVEFGISAFENTGITKMQINNTVEKIGDNAIDKKVVISCNKNSAAYEYGVKNGNKLLTTNYNKLLNIDNGTITGFNTNDEEYANFDGILNIPSIVNGQTVTSINSNAFQNNNKIISVNIPSTITTIGGYAFDGCSNLKELTFDEGEINTLFLDWHSFDNTSIEGTIIFPARVKDIHCEAFFNTKITDAWFYNTNQEFENGYRVIPTTAIVHGYTNSTAQTYTNNFGNTFVEITE